MRAIQLKVAWVIGIGLALFPAGGCSSGKSIKLEMERTVVTFPPTIQSITLSPASRIDTAAGPSTVTVRIEGDKGLQATFDVPGLVEAQSMREDSPGVYIGSFEVRPRLSGHVPVNGRLLHQASGAQKRISVEGGLELFSLGDLIPSPPVGACPVEAIREIEATLVGLAIHFEFNRSDITEAERTKLGQAVEAFKSHPECAIVVHGHADEIGDEGYNLALSMRRAMEAGAVLETLGMPPERVLRRWHGEAEPVELGEDEATRSKNRRVEFKAAPLR